MRVHLVLVHEPGHTLDDFGGTLQRQQTQAQRPPAFDEVSPVTNCCTSSGMISQMISRHMGMRNRLRPMMSTYTLPLVGYRL